MRVLLVADGRSPTTRRWAGLLASLGYELGLVSTFPCDPPDGIDYFRVIPVAFGQWAAGPTEGPAATTAARSGGVLALPGMRRLLRRFRDQFLAGRYSLGPLTVPAAHDAYLCSLEHFAPDLVHALRIPFEGMLAGYSRSATPLLVSIWGNDLTLHARGSARMAGLTRRSLAHASGLLADTRRDLRLARAWGLAPGAPALAVPGSGGLRLDEIAAQTHPVADLFPAPLPDDVELAVNARGFRPGSVRNETFFAAAPRMLADNPRLALVCPAMLGQPQAERWFQKMRSAGFGERIFLLPALPQARLWDLFHAARVFISPSAHDGTPNSLLEAMACGLFPVLGDIESMREWVTPGINGLLVDPEDARCLAEAVTSALTRPGLIERAAERNLSLVRERADVTRVRARVDAFYQALAAEALAAVPV